MSRGQPILGTCRRPMVFACAWLVSIFPCFAETDFPARGDQDLVGQVPMLAENELEGEGENEDKWYTVNGQFTVITQRHDAFPALYSGLRSLPNVYEMRTSATSTLFLGARLWHGAEIYFDPEVAGGRGVGDVNGLAGFPNGEIPRVSSYEAQPYVARVWLQQTIGLGGEQERVEAGPNQVAGYKDVSRITVAVGKMAATDWFDISRFSHDPRSQFFNWSLMYNGAWDYPADTRGYTWGGVVEYNQRDYALRFGFFGEPTTANGPIIDDQLINAHGLTWELEQRYELGSRPGRARWMAFLNRSRAGNYDEAVALSERLGVDPTTALEMTRTYNSRKFGFALNLEQELCDDVGAFLRLGWNDGHTETWAFTEIDRTVSGGIFAKGSQWGRTQDMVGVGLAINGISQPHQNYLAHGGYGFIIGDGALNYRPEIVTESYYRLNLKKDSLWVTPNFQVFTNPAYNRDRGPVVAIFGWRIHGEF
jgi:high affinity Mn2+ porin